MNSNVLGNTIIYVINPYQIYDYGFHFQNSSDFISNVEIEHLITESFYDKNSTNRGYTSYFFAKNMLESINEDVISKWANFSELGEQYLEDFLMNLVDTYKIDNHQEILDKIPLFSSPIITLSKEAISNYLLGKSGGTEKSFHFPDEGIGLFTELAKVELFDTNSLKKFTKNFGIPIGVDLSKKSGYVDLLDFKKYNTFLYFGAAPIALIYKELVEYQNIFNMFVAVKTNDKKLANAIYARKKLVQEIAEIGRFSKDILEKRALSKKTYEQNIIENNDPLSLALCRKYLSEAITEKVAINSKIVNSIDGDFFEIKLYNNLFEIAYNQIKDSLLNNTEIKKCEHCGHFFESTHGKQRFCPPLPFKKRSSCENSYSQQIRRTKEKVLSLFDSGSDIDEISKITNESLETINDWLNQRSK
ncbi:hypothetical protein P4604_17340 [Lysinibacillus capsici]|uniref:hypothetical protein n=1 Tax=Lysinibacillus capsici TaxID=2115968 RepID=UPI002E1F6ED4|nr:hypothetical protein [Lysinibacillus capsici]